MLIDLQMLWRKFSRQATLGLAGVSLMTGVSCSLNSNPVTVSESTRLVPRPADLTDESAQLARYVGQTSFLNPVSYGYEGMADLAKAAAPAAGGERTEQESDVFKVGKPGSKLLYLLNQERGLQVVSFEKGAELPELLGRVAPTGHRPSEMYYVASQDRLIALESRYDYEAHESKSRLAVYDVKDSKRPSLVEAVEVAGTIADSRIVGDVLYVASSVKDKGLIASYNVVRKSVTLVDKREVSLRVSGAQNMNILSIEKNGSFKYYLLATLSESGWGFFDRSSVVEVIDISNEKGQIKPVMSVATKGFVRERSQTMIKNDTLIVTSNYLLDQQVGGQRVARIAVETFRFPTENTGVISEKDASDRRGWIETELKHLYGEAREAMLEKLLNHPQHGLKNVLVRSENGDLRKPFADSVVTVGDGSGLSANLQDVRYQGDHLYAFWVPANEIDPFDLFDISEPEKGVRYISRLHFDGWIQRAIPIEVAGRKFVLGLGWIVPVVNNENRRRQPQAMIFEIVDVKGKLRALDVAQMTFEGSNIFSNFNGQDKEMEVRLDGPGQGEVLFSASRWDSRNYEDGGQILKFDLGAILAEKENEALKQGAFLSGGADWVRRVFTNSEIGRINSFSDKALATFGTLNSDKSTLAPVHILELARQIRGYETLKGRGVQIISEGYWSDRSQTELRLVNASRADEEKAQILGSVAIEGSYLGHIIDRTSGDLLVMTTQYSNVKLENGDYSYRTQTRVARLTLDAKSGALVKAGETQWVSERKDDLLPIGLRYGSNSYDYYSSSRGLVQLENGTILAQADSTVYQLQLEQLITAQPVDFATCAVEKRSDVEVQVLGGKTYLASKEVLESKKFEDVTLSRNYLAPVTISKGRATCGPATNIPGRALSVSATGEILTQDEWVQDIVLNQKKENEEDSSSSTEVVGAESDSMPMRSMWIPRWQSSKYAVITKSSLIALKSSEGQATLQDEVAGDQYANTIEAAPGEFVRVKKDGSWNGFKHQLEVLTVSRDARIQIEAFGFKSDLSEEAELVHLVKRPGTASSYYGLLRGGTEVAVIAWGADERRPTVQKVSQVNEVFEKGEPKTTATLPERWGYEAAHFTPELNSFELVLGLKGITQIYVMP